MYETVKVVKGYEIKRKDDGIGFREFHTFRTIKAATEFIETAL